MAVDLLSKAGVQLDIEFYVVKYIKPLVENSWLIIGCTLTGFLLALPVSLLSSPQYRSFATVLVEAPRARMVSKVTEKIGASPADKSYILAEAEQLKSGSFVTEVYKILPDECREDLDISLQLGDQVILGLGAFLKHTPLVLPILLIKKFKKSENKSARERQQKIIRLHNLVNRMDIKTKTSSGLVKITATAMKPEIAMIMVKSYLDVWGALNLEDNKRYIKRELAFAREQRKSYYNQLKQAESMLLDFKKKYEIPPPVTSVTDPEIQSRLEVLQNKVDSAKERYKQLDDIFLELNRKEKTVVSNIKVVITPQIPMYPSRTIRGNILLIGFFIGLLTGVVPILLWDYYNETIRHERDITDTMDVPILGNLPYVK